MELKILIAKSLQEPVALTFLILFILFFIFTIYLYISASASMYIIERAKYLGLHDSLPLNSLKSMKINLFDRIIIRSHLRKKKKYKDLFDKMYAIAIEKRDRLEKIKKHEKELQNKLV